MQPTALLSICAGFCPTWHGFPNDKRVKDLILWAKSVYVREIFPWLLWTGTMPSIVNMYVQQFEVCSYFQCFSICALWCSHTVNQCAFLESLSWREKMQKLSEGPIIQYQPFPILHIWRKYWYFLTLRIIQLIWQASQRSTCSPSLDSKQVFPHGW